MQCWREWPLLDAEACKKYMRRAAILSSLGALAYFERKCEVCSLNPSLVDGGRFLPPTIDGRCILNIRIFIRHRRRFASIRVGFVGGCGTEAPRGISGAICGRVVGSLNVVFGRCVSRGDPGGSGRNPASSDHRIASFENSSGYQFSPCTAHTINQGSTRSVA